MNKKKQSIEQPEDFVNYLFELQKRETIQPKCLNAGCRCQCCRKIEEKKNPILQINKQIQRIQLKFKNNVQNQNKSGLCEIIELILLNRQALPNFPILDTIIFKDGKPQYLLYFEDKMKIYHQSNLKNLGQFLLKRKFQADMEYLKKQFKRKNPNFFFILLDHESENKLKQFQKKIKEIHPIQRKVSYVKRKNNCEEIIVNQSQFKLLYQNSSRNARNSNIDDIQYIQLFPILTGQEEFFRTKCILFVRESEKDKQSFRMAERFFSVWYNKNQSIEKLEQQFIKQIKNKQEYLLYITYKLAIHIQHLNDYKIESFLVEFYTDKHNSSWIRNIKYLKYTKGMPITNYTRQHLLSKQKIIPIQKHINLSEKMKEQFKGFQDKFKEIYKSEVDRMITQIMDKQESQRTYQTLTSNKNNFEELLLSKDVSMKSRYIN